MTDEEAEGYRKKLRAGMEQREAGLASTIGSAKMAELLFAIEAALPFVRSHVGSRMCSSSGGPVALKNILKKYDWDNQRWKWVFPPNDQAQRPGLTAGVERNETKGKSNE